MQCELHACTGDSLDDVLRVATVVSLAALSLKAKMFRDQIRRRRTEFVLDDEEQTDRIVKLKKHTIRFA